MQATRTYCGRPPSLCSQAEGMPSRAARGDRKLGASGCWGTPWSEERLVASLTAAPRSGVRSGAKRVPVFWTPCTRLPSPTTVWYADSKVCPCTAVSTVESHLTLFFLPHSKVWVLYALSLFSKQTLFFREGGPRDLVHLREVFVWGGRPPRIRAAIYTRRVFDWG